MKMTFVTNSMDIRADYSTAMFSTTSAAGLADTA